MLRKLMLLAAMLAMVLVAAAPAFAQDVIAGDQYEVDDSFNTLTVAECIQLVDQSIDQDQYVSGDVTGGDADADADDDSNAAAGGGDATVEQSASQEAIQYCNDVVLADVVEAEAAEASASAAAGASAGAAAGGSAGAAASGGGGGTLPATGGISLLTLGAGALLVGGGLVARKLVR